jgi:predicted secreted Zn-dependent protease
VNNPEDLDWRTSSYTSNGSCVEVAAFGDHLLVRNSNNRGGPVVQFTSREWSRFLKGVHAGEFDLPLKPTSRESKALL